jgi:putative glutamine amidotransferase
MQQTQPLIGITLDYETKEGYSKFPWYALRENYVRSIACHEALAVCLPHEPEMAEAYLARLDGVIVTGGAFDIPPSFYGDASVHETVSVKERRSAFELAIARLAIARGKPILGICGGEQLLNVALGGSLIQHIPDAIPQALQHEQPNPRDQPGHSVRLTEGSLLRLIVGQEEILVNSAHHQAVAQPGEGVRVNALAPDGVIEGVEYPAHPFCLGVQWHPEYEISGADTAILSAFVQACRKGMRPS